MDEQLTSCFILSSKCLMLVISCAIHKWKKLRICISIIVASTEMLLFIKRTAYLTNVDILDNSFILIVLTHVDSNNSIKRLFESFSRFWYFLLLDTKHVIFSHCFVITSKTNAVSQYTTSLIIPYQIQDCTLTCGNLGDSNNSVLLYVPNFHSQVPISRTKTRGTNERPPEQVPFRKRNVASRLVQQAAHKLRRSVHGNREIDE